MLERMALMALLCAAGCGRGGSGVADAASVEVDGRVADPGDLLAVGSWECLEGARAEGEGVVIEGNDRWIIGYEAGQATANPPVMLIGPRLEVEGGFRVAMRIAAEAETPALLTLNGTLPIIYDEWRQEGTAIAVGLAGGQVLVQVWDGRDATPMVSRFGRGIAGMVELSLAIDGGTAAIALDGAEVGRVDIPALFPDGRVYFGADVARGNRLRLEALSAAPTGDGTVRAVLSGTPGAMATSPGSLRARAEGRLRIGTAVAPIPLLTEEPYRQTLGREHSMVTPENMMKFQFIHPGAGRYAFCDADALVDFALANGMVVHGHALVWHEAIPTWVSDGGFSDAEIAEILHEHITTVVGHFRGRVAEWDVLNEPLDDDSADLRQSIWQRALGDDFVATIFTWAHEADPDARLYVNEYGIESAGDKADRLFDLVEAAVQAGVPIHGVGFQAHEDLGEEAAPAELRSNMARYQSIGVDVRISELDDNPGDTPSAADLAAQADFFRQELEVCLALPHCKSFSMWGFTDKYSSLAPDDGYGEIGHGLIFDETYAPKPAYDALADVLGAP
jgi:endo-1,4-beta-xylanase